MVSSYTAICTWTSSPYFVTPGEWERQWYTFAKTAMYSEHCVYNSSASEWKVRDDQKGGVCGTSKGFCGLIRWKDVDGHRGYIDGKKKELKRMSDVIPIQNRSYSTWSSVMFNL